MKIPYIEKNNGNIKAKKGDFYGSMKHYSKALLAIKYLKEGGNFNKPELISTYIKDIEIPVNLNLALCNLKINNFNNAIHHANAVLEHDPKNCKAFFRRGIAYHKIANVFFNK